MNQQRIDSAGPSTPQLWRALEERVDAPAFQEMLLRDFPDDTGWTDPVTRRRFLMLAGASLGLAGLAGCTKPPRELIVPYVHQPEQLVLGKPMYYATAMPMAGSAIGVLVESHEGRPTKVEGNPDHPLSGGATDLYAQASVLNLYDPDRSQAVVYRGHLRSWEDAIREVHKRLGSPKAKADEKAEKVPVLRILTDAVASPTLTEQLKLLLAKYPGSQWVEWEPALAFSEAEAKGSEMVFGKPYAVHYDLTKADVILTLDADLLVSGPEHIKYAREFAARRRVPIEAEMPGQALRHEIGDLEFQIKAALEAEQAALARAKTEKDEAAKATANVEAATQRSLAQSKTIEKNALVARTKSDPHTEGGEHEHKLSNWSRLYAVESTPTPTGMQADNRLALPPSLVGAFARKVAEALDIGMPRTEDLPELSTARKDRTVTTKIWIEEVVKDLTKAAKGRSLVVAGEGQPAAVHALALAINDKLGNIGSTVTLTELPPSPAQRGIKALQKLTEEMAAKQVDLLLILGPNPVHSAPADLDFAGALRKVPFTLHHSLYVDETSTLCQWHLPQTHYLETWGDVVAHDGTATIMQPLIAPLYKGRPPVELLSALIDEEPQSAHELVRATWQKWHGVPKDSVPSPAFEKFWTESLNNGTVAKHTAKAAEGVKAKDGWWKTGLDKAAPPPSATDMTLVFRLDPTLFDGQFANNGWLQELPKPVTKLTWGNAAIVSPATAEKLDITQKVGGHGGNYGELITDIVELKYRGRPPLKVPVYVQPGQPDWVVTVHFGHGRGRAGSVGTDIGFNAASLWTSDAPLSGDKLTVTKTNETFILACTQILHTMGSKEPRERGPTDQVQARGILRIGTVAEYNKDPREVIEKYEHESEEEKKKPEEEKKKKTLALTMFASQGDVDGLKDADGKDIADPKLWDNKHQWAMAIDLSACTGCSACVVACQAENNISVVGKEQVTRGRAMHWLRIDRYFMGDDNELTKAYTQPVPCMQCENAPCELVCPVEATSHSPDGLNDMTYNRCVGTRYCANNCPYKVRRFNFLEFADYSTKSLYGLRNPDVTVRTRGVMEKCTYCVQRIRVAGIEARNQGREIKDGEIVTACEAACPSQAIVFGNKKDPNSRVSKLRETPVNYGLLEELNTRPRTTYLAALKNPNERLLEINHGH